MADGTYGLGTSLPSHRVLALELGVSEWAVRKALQPLRDTGDLRSIPGRGNVAVDRQATGPVSYGSKQIEQILRARIADGTYAARTWLPPLSDLAVEFGVSTTTAHTATRPLKEEKLLGQRGVLGTYVIDPEAPTEHAPGSDTARCEQAIRTRLRDGTYLPGSRLPTNMALADEFNVGKGVIRSALKPIREDGLVASHAGLGSYVTDPRALQPIDGARAVEQIIRARIAEGTYAAHTWLPPRTLAAEFGVSHSTVQAAMTPLKREKLIASTGTPGTYVIDPQRPLALPPGKTPHHAVHIGQVIRQRLRDGIYPPGRQLPTVLKLSVEFGVTRNTISKAFKPLKKSRLVVSGLQGKVYAARQSATDRPGLLSAEQEIPQLARATDLELERGSDRA